MTHRIDFDTAIKRAPIRPKQQPITGLWYSLMLLIVGLVVLLALGVGLAITMTWTAINGAML